MGWEGRGSDAAPRCPGASGERSPLGDPIPVLPLARESLPTSAYWVGAATVRISQMGIAVRTGEQVAGRFWLRFLPRQVTLLFTSVTQGPRGTSR